jgi:hypothetical protein
MANPSRYLLKCTERLLRYLFTTVNFGLVLNGGKDPTLLPPSVYAYSFHVLNSHSTTGPVRCLSGGPVH